ncbi:MAG: hypothetical protein N2690_00540 [Rhodocyclaceae bacterium]|nr:hypothetical protein [Rhodocyclaceae bacterium]
MTDGLADLVVELALYTHWPRTEILAMDIDDFVHALLTARRLSQPQ